MAKRLLRVSLCISGLVAGVAVTWMWRMPLRPSSFLGGRPLLAGLADNKLAGGAAHEAQTNEEPAPSPASLVTPARGTPERAPETLDALERRVSEPPEHLRAWEALRRKALRTKAEDAGFQLLTKEPTAVRASLALLVPEAHANASDTVVAAQSKREFAIEHLRAALECADPEEKDRLAQDIETAIHDCDVRTSPLAQQPRGFARADCAALLATLMTLAPDSAKRAVEEGQSPIAKKIATAARELVETQRKL